MANITLNVTDNQGKATGTVDAPAEIFGFSAEEVQSRIPLIHQVVIAQLAAFVDGARGFRSVVGRDATRVGELAEELLQASLILGDVREVLGVGAVQVGLSGTSRQWWSWGFSARGRCWQ